MSTLHIGIAGIGILAPGLNGWPAARPLLCTPAAWRRAPTVVPAPSRLPPNERRRASVLTKASIGVADEALAMARADPSALETVFVSSTSDTANCHALCEALAASERTVSPTRFTNSVHNASAGYWHIAARSRAASTSLAGHDASFAAGLLEAAAACTLRRRAQLLVVCDVPFPAPLHALRPLPDVVAVALLLQPAGGALGGIDVALADGTAAVTDCGDAALDAVRTDVPAARALPLLQAIAGGRARDVVIEGWSGAALRLRWSPAIA